MAVTYDSFPATEFMLRFFLDLQIATILINKIKLLTSAKTEFSGVITNE